MNECVSKFNERESMILNIKKSLDYWKWNKIYFIKNKNTSYRIKRFVLQSHKFQTKLGECSEIALVQ